MPQSPLDPLDAFFSSRGLVAGKAPLNSGRTWQGAIAGRTVHIVCSHRSRTNYLGADVRSRSYAGHAFSIEVGTTLCTRLTAMPATTNAAAGLLDRLLRKRVGLLALEAPLPAYAHLKVSAFEASWAHAFLEDPRVEARLTEELVPIDALNGTFALQPRFALFRCRCSLSDITPAFAERQLESLLDLAAIAEALPAPSRTATPSRLETMAREKPALFMILLFAGLLAVVLAGSAVVIAALIAIAYFRLQGYLLLAGVGYGLWRRRRKKREAESVVAST